MSFSIRKAAEQDFEQAYKLIKELAAYEKAPEEVELSLQEFKSDGSANPPAFQLRVAEASDGSIVGMALFYVIYSTWKGKIVYLDDLVVTEQYRRSGVGSALMDQVIAYARELKARQLRWHVLDWNEPAINLYKKMGVKIETEWDTCKMSLAQMDAYESL